VGDFEKADDFGTATVATVDESGRWTAQVAPGWDIGGHPHGGYLMALAARIALGVTGRDHPLSITAHFLRSPANAPVTAKPSLLRAGRSTSVAAVDLCQDGQPILATLTTTGRVPATPAPIFQRDRAPTLPAPDDCIDVSRPDSPFRQNLHDKVDIRLDPATVGWAFGQPGRAAESQGWVRPRDGFEPDPLFLLLAVDALPPVTFDFGLFGWAPTVELTALLRGAPAPGWLRVVMRSQLIDDGWLDEDVEVWDSADRLVAQGRQLAGYRPPEA
jgi:Thioesterase-like superfamily